jgi:hydrogenase expression/formation protein HypD
VEQLEKGQARVENQYGRVARDEGNKPAREIIDKVFKIDNRVWRGIGEIPLSGYELNDNFLDYDASLKFKTDLEPAAENSTCIAGEVLKGIKKPHQCPAFGHECSPENPLGAPMVSSEGACAAYYHYAVQ